MNVCSCSYTTPQNAVNCRVSFTAPINVKRLKPSSCFRKKCNTSLRSQIRSHATSNSGEGDGERWWENLRRDDIFGPDGKDTYSHSSSTEGVSIAEQISGMSAFRQMDELEKGERQRVWDSIRASAWTRYQNGEMPPWFKLEWIMQEEAPLNRMLRLEDYEASLANATATGGGDDGGKSGGGSGGWKGPWREEDPYWPLRDWGDHPMRWWTLAFAAVLAVGGVMGYTSHGCAESLFVGGAAAALLSMCAMAMSDMTDWGHGQLAAKAAFAICAALAIKEIFFGWTHRPVPDWSSEYRWRTASKVPGSYTQLGNTGFFCMAMCMAYMLTDLSGLDEWALPITPGAVYKGTDVAFKQRVWEKWGYGDMPMRPP